MVPENAKAKGFAHGTSNSLSFKKTLRTMPSRALCRCAELTSDSAEISQFDGTNVSQPLLTYPYRKLTQGLKSAVSTMTSKVYQQAQLIKRQI